VDPEGLSPARQRLAEIIEALNRASADVEAAGAPATRLREVIAEHDRGRRVLVECEVSDRTALGPLPRVKLSRLIRLGRPLRPKRRSTSANARAAAEEALPRADEAHRLAMGSRASPSGQVAQRWFACAPPEPASEHIPPNTPCVARGVWRRYCEQGGISGSDDPAAFRKAWERHHKALIGSAVGEWTGYVWVIRP